MSLKSALLLSLVNAVSAAPCQCKDSWTNDADPNNAENECGVLGAGGMQSGCPAKTCDGKDPWCVVTDPTCDTVQVYEGEVGKYSYTKCKVSNPCVCKKSWTNDADPNNAENVCGVLGAGGMQTSCPATTCDGKDPWCIVTDPTCDTAQTYEGEVGKYVFSKCEADNNPCICKSTWTNEADPNNAENECGVIGAGGIQSGCPAETCDGNAPWCIIENPGCDTEKVYKGEVGKYSFSACTPTPTSRLYATNIPNSWSFNFFTLTGLATAVSLVFFFAGLVVGKRWYSASSRHLHMQVNIDQERGPGAEQDRLVE